MIGTKIFFSVKNFEFTLNRLPNVEFFIQNATIPGVTIPDATQTTPFSNIPRPGNKLLFEELQLTARARSPLVIRAIEDALAGKKYPVDLIYEHPFAQVSASPFTA